MSLSQAACTQLTIDTQTQQQVDECLMLVKEVLDKDLLGVYLYGSAVLGGLQRYSDIDLFVVSNRPTTHKEKSKLAKALLQISGIYMRSKKLPLELTIVEKSAITPWHYPPIFDFQYGEWLRTTFEQENVEPWPTKVMPDLAILVTQILLASTTLMGPEPNQLLCKVPYKDFIAATADALPHLMSDLESDTRNVLLTLARIWSTVTTDTVRSKQAAADWATKHLPKEYIPVMQRAKAICIGTEQEYWDDLNTLLKPCANFMLNKANEKISAIMASRDVTKKIKIT